MQLYHAIRQYCSAHTSLPSAVVMCLPSGDTSMLVTSFPVSSVRTMEALRMSHTLQQEQMLCLSREERAESFRGCCLGEQQCTYILAEVRQTIVHYCIISMLELLRERIQAKQG